MTLDWTHFTPGSARAGGLLIGLAAQSLAYPSERAYPRSLRPAPRARSAAPTGLAVAGGGNSGADRRPWGRAPGLPRPSAYDRCRMDAPGGRRPPRRLRDAARQRLHERPRRVRPRAPFTAVVRRDRDLHGRRLRDRLCGTSRLMKAPPLSRATPFLVGLLFGLGLLSLQHDRSDQGARLSRSRRRLGSVARLRHGRRHRGRVRSPSSSRLDEARPCPASRFTCRPTRRSTPASCYRQGGSSCADRSGRA